MKFPVYVISVLLALQKITNLALVYKWICREEMWGWAGTITGYQGLLALSSAPPTWDNIPLGYMDITFPHGCVLCIHGWIAIHALQKSLFSPASSFSYIFIKVLPVQVPAQMPQRSIIIRCAANLLHCYSSMINKPQTYKHHITNKQTNKLTNKQTN